MITDKKLGLIKFFFYIIDKSVGIILDNTTAVLWWGRGGELLKISVNSEEKGIHIEYSCMARVYSIKLYE